MRRDHFAPLSKHGHLDNSCSLDCDTTYHGVFWRELDSAIDHRPLTYLRMHFPELTFAYEECAKGAPRDAVAKRQVKGKRWLVARWRTSRLS